jgi:hypothetical protein
MKFTDPIMIGYLAIGEPIILGWLKNHGFRSDMLIGTVLNVNGRFFTFNVSYIPNNPKRQRLVGILIPMEELDADFWTGNVIEVENKKPIPRPKQEEFPF